LSKILLLLDKNTVQTKHLAMIKKYTNLGLGNIKNRIENSSPIFECDLFKNEDDDAKLKNLITYLTNDGIKMKIYEGEISSDKEVSTEYLMNRLKRFKEIQAQNELQDDLMYGED
jgi:bacterioferritin (cytochrome b1)